MSTVKYATNSVEVLNSRLNKILQTAAKTTGLIYLRKEF